MFSHIRWHSRQNSFKRITVTEADVMVPFSVLFVVNFALLLAWTLLDPLVFERIKVHEDSPFSDTYGTCKFESESNRYGVGLAFPIVLVNFCAILLACAQAYRARHISDEFSESRWVAFTVASWAQVFVVGCPVLFLVQEQPTAFYFLKVSIVFVACMSLLLFMFVPKVLIRRQEQSSASTQQTFRASSSKFNLYHSSRQMSKDSGNSGEFEQQTGPGLMIINSRPQSQIELEERLKDQEAKIKELQEKVSNLQGGRQSDDTIDDIERNGSGSGSS